MREAEAEGDDSLLDRVVLFDDVREARLPLQRRPSRRSGGYRTGRPDRAISSAGPDWKAAVPDRNCSSAGPA